MGNTFSFLPTWLVGGASPDPLRELEDDTTAGVEASNALDAVETGHMKWSSSFVDRNFMAVAKLYSHDCKVCPSGTRTAYGRHECAMGWESLLATGVDKVTFQNTTIDDDCGEDMVSETSEYNLYGLDGDTVIDSGKHIMLWKKLNGKWYIHLHIFSSTNKADKGPGEHISEASFMWEYCYFMRDFEALSNLYTDECVLCPPAWKQIEGTLPVQRFWSRFPSMGVDRQERTVISVDEMGPNHLAADIGYTMYDYQNGIIDIGRSVCIFKQMKDGRWCIHDEIFNSSNTIVRKAPGTEEVEPVGPTQA